MQTWMVLPGGGASWLCRVTAEGDRARVDGRCPLPAPDGARWCVDPERDLVAWASGGRAHVARGAFFDAEARVLPLGVPARVEARAVVLHQGVLFVAGLADDALVLARDLDDPSAPWERLPSPPELRAPGKAIDDLALDGGTLLALDDVVVPKYLVRYDVGDARSPRLAGRDQLPSHGTWERYHDVAVGERVAFLRSTTMSRAGEADHVAALDRATLRSRLVATSRRPHRARTPGPLLGIAAAGDRLFVALGAGGVGVLDEAHVRAALAEDEAAWRRRWASGSAPPLRKVPVDEGPVEAVYALRPDLALAVVRSPVGGRDVVAVPV